jgi:hypothetical protein
MTNFDTFMHFNEDLSESLVEKHYLQMKIKLLNVYLFDGLMLFSSHRIGSFLLRELEFERIVPPSRKLSLQNSLTSLDALSIRSFCTT